MAVANLITSTPAADEYPGNESPLEGGVSPLSREVTMQTRTKHVLLVEDEEAHAELMELSFESRADIRLTVATSLAEARLHLAQSRPDLLIIDSLLPDGRGLELLKDDRREDPYPVILLTSHADETMQAEAMEAGASRYVVKSEVTLLDMPQLVDDVLLQSDAVEPGSGAET